LREAELLAARQALNAGPTLGENTPTAPRNDPGSYTGIAITPGIGGFQSGDGPGFDIDKFAFGLFASLANNTLGFSYAINKGGRLYDSGGFGYAQRPGDGDLLMTDETRFNIASVSKNLTGIGALQLIHRLGLDLDDKIHPWLPADWPLHDTVYDLTFRHLLTHRSGIFETDDSWQGLKNRLSDPVIPRNIEPIGNVDDKLDHKYSNINYGLFRVMIAKMSQALEPDALPGEITEQNAGLRYVIYMQQHVFEPIGIDHAMCMPVEPKKVAKAYLQSNPATDPGFVLGDDTDLCGGGGWYLSAVDLARVQAYLRYTDILLPNSMRAEMDSNFIGWFQPELAPKSTWGTYHAHGGDLFLDRNGDNVVDSELHTCVIKFPIDVEAVVLINSDISPLQDYQCTILRKGYEDAWN
jgi:CubicO group peptidase (beta-lactamase class C family)